MLLFIWACPLPDATPLPVSIHLMLLFIVKRTFVKKVSSIVSIHLMLLFISVIIFCHSNFLLVSIHLMLLFIVILKRKHRPEISFNTSHVVIYPFPCFILSIWYLCFNTSHVVIYQNSRLPAFRASSKFQYISCCYLS